MPAHEHSDHATAASESLSSAVAPVLPHGSATASGPGGAEQATATNPGSPPDGGRAWPTMPGYEVLGQLGRGGMGVVYKAVQVNLKRLVALKTVLAGAHAAPDDLVRFRHEAEAVARLQHPNIVQIFEVGQQNGLPYFSMEYVEGGSLSRRLDGTPLPAKDAARLVETLARAVHAAHQQGIVHRDLKPANVLLSKLTAEQSEGTAFAPSCFTPKLTDFGLAKRLEGGPGLTQTGAVMGTPSYMAPEQASGKGKAVGPAADIYSLGAILYELLTGRPPFKAATAHETLTAVVSEEPVAPSRLVPRLPTDIETIALKCLEKDPDRRYASAEELAEDIGRFVRGDSVRARPVTVIHRAWRWMKRNRLAASLGVTCLFLLLLGTGVSTWLAIRLERALHQRALAEPKLAELRGLFIDYLVRNPEVIRGHNKQELFEKFLESDPHARRLLRDATDILDSPPVAAGAGSATVAEGISAPNMIGD